jgi:succinoglycan biosynthesis transport protein ExoP
MDPMRTLAIVRRWLPLLIASMVLAAGAAYAISSIQQKTYQAGATLIVGQSLTSTSPDYNQLLTSQQLSSTYASLATTRPILEAVISELALDTTPEELLKRVSAEARTDSTLLSISAMDSDPARAAAIANAMADRLVAASAAIQGRQADIQASIDADLAATQDQIVTTQGRITELSNQPSLTADEETELATLQARLVTLRATYATLLGYSSASATNLITVVEPAAPPTDPTSPRPLLNTLVAALVGLLLAAGIVFVVEYVTDALRNPEEVEEATGLATLGSIGRMRSGDGRREMYQLSALLYPRSPITEAYRTLRTNLEFASIDKPARSLLVASTRAGEGKTVTASNLALVFAQAGRRVLLIDADLRKPGVHAVFNLPNPEGLTTLLRSDDARLEQLALSTEQENLRVLTTGPLPPNPTELLGSQRMRAILATAESVADLVIVDSPPIHAFADASILGSLTDGTLLVIDATRSRRRYVRLGREVLARAGASVLGVVINRAPQQSPAGYGYGYGEYYTEPVAGETGELPRNAVS